MPEPADAKPGAGRLSPRARRVLGWLLAPALASLAITLQICLDVPRGEMIEREEPKKKKKQKQKQKQKQKKTTAARRTKPASQTWKTRSAKELAKLRARWSERPFADEPTDQRFRRRHEALLRSVATRARAEVRTGDKPTPMQIRPACHTIRCELELCGPEPMLGDIAELLPGVTVGDQPLWHELRELEIDAEASERGDTREHVCRRWLVDFAIEGPEAKDLRMPK